MDSGQTFRTSSKSLKRSNIPALILSFQACRRSNSGCKTHEKKNPKRSFSGPLFDLSFLGYCWQLNTPTEGAGPLFMQKAHPKVVCIHVKIRVVFINEKTLTDIILHL